MIDMKEMLKAPHLLWRSMDTIFEYVQANKDWMDELPILSEDLAIVRSFFSCDEKQALLFTLLLMSYYKDETASVAELMNIMQVSLPSAAYIHDVLDVFVKRNWIHPEKDKRIQPRCNYIIAPMVLKALYGMDQAFLQEKPIVEQEDLFVQIPQKLKERKARTISYYEIIDWVDRMIQQYPSFPLHTLLLEYSLSKDECLVMYFLMSKLRKNIQSIDFDQIFDELQPPLEKFHKLKNGFDAAYSPLLTQGLVEMSPSIFGSDCWFKLSRKAIQTVLPIAELKEEKLNSSLVTMIQPHALVEQTLIYTDTVSQQMAKLDRLLSPEFHQQCERMLTDKGMSKGINILLHGYPGTGKTESVKQLARKHQREIMFVEMAAIRNKFVGETEKRLKEIFVTYQNSYKNASLAPILLFNEADALFGKRREVINHLDQYDNGLQNILLQELENFEGIFIATTNLINNLDSAFDRRFLYKVAFEKPNEATVMAMWAKKFPELAETVIHHLSSRWLLSGGQIENIRKRYELESLIDPDISLNVDYLATQCAMENAVQAGVKGSREPIGFRRPSQPCEDKSASN